MLAFTYTFLLEREREAKQVTIIGKMYKKPHSVVLDIPLTLEMFFGLKKSLPFTLVA